MHDQIPRPQDSSLQRKSPQNSHRFADWAHKQEAPRIMEVKDNPAQSIPDPSLPGESFFASPSSPTPSYESAEWEQLSTGTEQSLLSAEFEVLKGYNRVPLYERRAQWLAEQQARREQKLQTSSRRVDNSKPAAFQPNSQLPFPITAQFLRYYGSSSSRTPSERSPQSDDSQRTVVAPPDTPATTSSYLSTPTSPPSSPESAPETSSFTQNRGKKPTRPEPPSRKTSGIPSFTSLFESKWNWDRSPKPRNGDRSPNIPRKLSGRDFPGFDLKQKTNLEIIHPPSGNMVSRLGCILGRGGMALLALTIAGSFCLTVFSTLIIPYPASAVDPHFPLHGLHNTSSHMLRPPHVDFTTLMSIETSLERIVESATGGSTLARLLKQGEMAVNDLGTVVKHSDLSCRGALGDKLDRFASDARDGVNALQLFETKVGEVLDQLLGANQDLLQEFAGQLKRQRRLRYGGVPFISRSVDNTHTLIRLSENYNRTAYLLESSLGTLIFGGKSIIESLDGLIEQHNPIYDEIVREFVNLDRRGETTWARIGWESSGASLARKLKTRESKELLALVGGYEEMARGYVENIRLELESMMGGMENLQKRISRDILSLSQVTVDSEANGSIGMPLKRQLEAVEETVAAMLRKRRQRTRRSAACSMGVLGNKARNETGMYLDIFTPTRTSTT